MKNMRILDRSPIAATGLCPLATHDSLLATSPVSVSVMRQTMSTHTQFLIFFVEFEFCG